MSDKQKEIRENELHAYVDHELPENRVPEVQSWLQDHPEASSRVHQWQMQNEAIVGTYDDERFERIPDRLNPRKLKQRHRPPLYAVAASILLMLASGLLGWFSHGYYQQERQSVFNIVRPAISAYQVYASEVKHPVEVGANEEKHLVKWLSKRLDYPLHMPKLDALGFRLIGGRLLAVSQGPAAQFMFENPAGQRITLFAARNLASRETAFHFTRVDGVKAFYWLDEDIGYAIIGEVDRETLLRISHKVYDQLNEAPKSKSNSRV